MRRITVFVDERPYAVLQDTEVGQLAGLLDPETQIALANGLARFIDRFGNPLGSGGGLSDGQRLFVSRDV